MKNHACYPLRLKPLYKAYPWGGQRILKTYGRKEPEGIYAESWEVVDRKHEQSVVAQGPWAGKTLREVIARHGRAVTGAKNAGRRFPLLVKLIDARERLSVQVHPSEKSAARTGGDPKTEMWHVLAADPGAQVWAGLKAGIIRSHFEKALRAGRVQDCLRRIPIRPGDTLWIPGGRVHAIDAGCLLFEVQQNSDTTYRLHDWDRLGPDGEPRPLHVAEALESIQWDDWDDALRPPRPVRPEGRNTIQPLVRDTRFRVWRLDLHEPYAVVREKPGWDILFVMEGVGSFEWRGAAELLSAGATWLVPAAIEAYTLRPERHSQVLRITAGD